MLITLGTRGLTLTITRKIVITIPTCTGMDTDLVTEGMEGMEATVDMEDMAGTEDMAIRIWQNTPPTRTKSLIFLGYHWVMVNASNGRTTIFRLWAHWGSSVTD